MDLEDAVTPEYRFEWEDGTVRSSDEIGDLDQLDSDITIEDIAFAGEVDPECEVTLVGYST